MDILEIFKERDAVGSRKFLKERYATGRGPEDTSERAWVELEAPLGLASALVFDRSLSAKVHQSTV